MKSTLGITWIVALMVLLGCKPKAEAQSAPTPESTQAPAPTQEATPAPVDKTAQVTVLGYHRFENPPKDPLAISTEEFRQQMQALKDLGITVISMADFLAWRRGEKSIPARSVVITIDDGYNDSYTQAWPVLKEFGYPFTMYVYTDYISAGGRSITWAQLAEMRDAGVDIGSHTASHDNLAKPKKAKNPNYEEWLKEELKGSKEILEKNLGIVVKTLAYPFGIHNENVMQAGLDSGYEALFTVYGTKIGYDVNPAKIGRYVIQSGHPIIFKAATMFGTATLAPTSVSSPTSASAPVGSIPTLPPQGGVATSRMPRIEADLSSMGNVDPKSVEMRIGGLGQVMAVYDPATRKVTYQPTQRLREKATTVVVSAKGSSGRVETRWTFTIEPAAAPTPKLDDEALMAPSP